MMRSFVWVVVLLIVVGISWYALRPVGPETRLNLAVAEVRDYLASMLTYAADGSQFTIIQLDRNYSARFEKQGSHTQQPALTFLLVQSANRAPGLNTCADALMARGFTPGLADGLRAGEPSLIISNLRSAAAAATVFQTSLVCLAVPMDAVFEAVIDGYIDPTNVQRDLRSRGKA